jgi:hypothetical protein
MRALILIVFLTLAAVIAVPAILALGCAGGGGLAALITVLPATETIPIGQTQQFTATVRNTTGELLPEVTVAWSSTDTTVATVNTSGLATAVGVGRTSITALSPENPGIPAGSASLTVTEENVIVVDPGESIQAAVDSAQAGQTVLIQPGTYRPSAAAEALVVVRAASNGITIRGGGASSADVILDGNNQVLHVIFFDAGIDRGTILENLTVTGGYAYPETVLPAGYAPVLRPELDISSDFYHDGAGLMLFSCAPTIRDCRIADNHAYRCGAGISAFCVDMIGFPNPGPLITGNEIRDNILDPEFSGTGGGVDVYFGARATISNNLFVGNQGWGSAVAALDGATADIDCNTLVANRGSGVATTATSTATVTNTIFADHAEGAPLDASGALTCTNCCFWNSVEPWDPPEGQGHVVADPLFVTGPEGDYYLSQIASGQPTSSPCVDAGSVPAADAGVANRTTRTDGVIDSGSVDIGYHYRP